MVQDDALTVVRDEYVKMLEELRELRAFKAEAQKPKTVKSTKKESK